MNKTLQKIYDISPPTIQNAIISLYGLRLYSREYGRSFRDKSSEFEQRERLSHAELVNYQEEKLRQLVSHAYGTVPYYAELMRGLKITPADIRTIDDLQKLPLLKPDDIRENFPKLISTDHRRSKLIHGHTSGTTGTPLQFLYDQNVCLIKNVVDWRQKHWAGIKFGDRVALLLGRIIVPTGVQNPPFWRSNLIMKQLWLSSFHMSQTNLSHYCRKLVEFKPKAIEGYPSTLSILASYLLSQGLTIPLRAAFTSSETLYESQREAIEEAFQCELFDYYGLAERTVFASECSHHSGHHLNMDFGITEVISKDGTPAGAGQLGRLVSTGLHNFAMPLIRYETSDVTAINPSDCACGCQFPLMDDVTTKAEDIITTPDGRYVSSSVLTHPFKPLDSISLSQIIQEDINNVVVKIVPRDEFDKDNEEYLIRELQERLGADMNIRIEIVNDIARTKAGKYRWVISRVPLDF
jgi:phenylacetate-CoA ligase